MPDMVKLPGGGPGVSKKWVLAGGALVAGIVGYAYLRRARTVAGPDVGQEQVGMELPPADLGSVSTGGGTSDTGLQFITTNAQWSADATAKLVDLGYDSVAVSTALGKYLSSQFVTAQEAQYIYTALALSGSPPVGTFSVRREPTPTSTSGSATGHKYVAQLHEFTVNTGVRDAVRRFSAPAPISNANSIQVAVARTVADPRNAGDTFIKGGIGYFRPRRRTYVTTVQPA